MTNHKARLSKLERPARTTQARQFRPQTQEEINREQAKRDGIFLKMEEIAAMHAQGVNPYMYMPRGQLIETAQAATQDTNPETAGLRAEILQWLQRIAKAQNEQS